MLTGGVAMTKKLLLGLIKFFMMSMPFLSMILMLLALWGVIGSATYADLSVATKETTSHSNEAKNYMVSDTKSIEHCPQELKDSDITMNPENASSEANPMPKKIDWEHIV